MGPGQACKKLRAEMGADAFRAAYGTNRNGANAFGKCVSKMARAKDDAARAAAVVRIVDTATRCAARATTSHGDDDHGKSHGKGHGKGAQMTLAECLRKAV